MNARPTTKKPGMRRAVYARLRRIWTDTGGATAVEYGFILALIVLVMFAALASVGDVTISMWNNINDRVTNQH